MYIRMKAFAPLLLVVLTGCINIPSFEKKSEINSASLEAVVEANPQNVHAQYLLGKAALENSDPAEAEDRFEKVIKLNPMFEEAWKGLGIALMDQKKYTKATRIYNDMAKQFPASATPHEGLAAIAYARGKFDDMDAHARQAIWQNDRSAQGLRFLGESAYVKGDYQLALEYWKKAIGADPTLREELRPVAEDLEGFLQKYDGKPTK